MDVTPAGSPPREGPHHRRILVAAADPLFARVLRTKLEAWGYRPQVEASGSAALEWYRVNPFPLVIAELDLPGLSGLELIRRIRALQPTGYTHIVACGDERGDLMAVLEAGADDFVAKPLNPIELQLRLRHAQKLLELDDAAYSGSGTDRMTGLLNRAAFNQVFPIMLAQARRAGQTGTLMFVRIANLHQVYRRHGYQGTRRVVIEVGKAIRDLPRESDLVAKFTDDEFVLVLHGTLWDTCLPVARRLAERVGGLTVDIDGDLIHCDCAIGSVNFPQGAAGAQEIVAAVRTPFDGVRPAQELPPDSPSTPV